MDRTCDHCGHTTDDGIGVCRFCRTPFPELEKESDVDSAKKSRKTRAKSE